LGCSQTDVAFGSRSGAAFTDFNGSTSCPCGEDIREIRISHSIIIDAIQVTYRTVDGEIVSEPKRGGGGGREDVVRLAKGEWLTGVTGVECTDIAVSYLNRYVMQMVFFSEKEDGERAVYGPYGKPSPLHESCRIFAVNGRITSIFGRVLTEKGYTGLGAIGFYYEDVGKGRQSVWNYPGHYSNRQ
jgi:hypothetical protein